MRITKKTAPWPAEVVEKGWSHGRLPAPADADWSDFARFWEDLPPDRYVVREHGTTRNRRLGQLLAPAGSGLGMERMAHGVFYQSSEVNSVYGGQRRTFAPIADEVYDNPCFRAALEHDLGLIRRIEGEDGAWLITVHMIRITATGSDSSAPAPEGRHNDGHDYVIMHLVGRDRCAGGHSRVYRKGGGRPALEHTLERPMETLVLDDRTMEHEVTPITPTDSTYAVRDMMIIDFERAESHAFALPRSA
ncbi:2OG-Fe dioxygenase family protein [Sphaerisporangium aureirubrum]|uniref:2OG-Fe dioxygenase family protein n=1 Tax=Sphaerisporangium aureirubrum TaxID=1544736 RepID=A0ABW1NIC4_9ACTN